MRYFFHYYSDSSVNANLERAALHQRLDEAFSILNGLQQGEPDPNYKIQEELKDIVRDFAAAFTNRPIEFGYQFNYVNGQPRNLDGYDCRVNKPESE